MYIENKKEKISNECDNNVAAIKDRFNSICHEKFGKDVKYDSYLLSDNQYEKKFVP